MSSTTEDYLKKILSETQSTGTPLVSLGRLASLAGVTPGTVTSMMKRLADESLIDYFPRRGVRLTPTGIRQATRMLRRHRLIETFLVETLGLDWSEVHSEAELLEHAVSDRIIDRMDEILGHPIADPHGDPIPQSGVAYAAPETCQLTDGEVGVPYVISRITHDEPSFLDYAKRNSLTPGQDITLLDRDAHALTVRVAAGNREVTLSFTIAERILVAADSPEQEPVH